MYHTSLMPTIAWRTHCLTVFDPTSESRQFYDIAGSAYLSEHSSWSVPACSKVVHIQSMLGAVMWALTPSVLPHWRSIGQRQVAPNGPMHGQLWRSFFVQMSQIGTFAFGLPRSLWSSCFTEPQRLMTGFEHPMPASIVRLRTGFLYSDTNGRLQVNGVGRSSALLMSPPSTTDF
ncbi:hypothetical protein C8F01DRAFT_347709 [Mycena amicta]|nr:hypothetical protein C8F01DRAFT_347709 [Mycena amicta]